MDLGYPRAPVCVRAVTWHRCHLRKKEMKKEKKRKEKEGKERVASHVGVKKKKRRKKKGKKKQWLKDGDKRADGFINGSDGESNSLEIAFCSCVRGCGSPGPANKPIRAHFRRVVGAALMRGCLLCH